MLYYMLYIICCIKYYIYIYYYIYMIESYTSYTYDIIYEPN